MVALTWEESYRHQVGRRWDAANHHTGHTAAPRSRDFRLAGEAAGLLSYEKEGIGVGSNEVVEPRAYYTEWSRSERNILIINTYIWNLERCNDDPVCRRAKQTQV